MELNARLDQSLDEIIQDNRKQRKVKSVKKNKAPKKAALAKEKPTIKELTTASLRKKKTSASPFARNGKNNIASRLGATATGSRVLGRGGASGRIGKSKTSSRINDTGRLAGLAERKKKIARQGVKPATAPVNISIKGEAGPATIFITNLDTEASSEDVKTCFKQFGAICGCTLLYDRSGKASGHAEVVYTSKASALEAIAKLNNALADGRRLTVQLKPNVDPAPQPQTQSAKTFSNPPRRNYRRGRGNMSSMDID